jgi:outer membrane usher protein
MFLWLPKRNPSRVTVHLRLGLLPLLILGALSEYAHGAAVDPANPASPADASAAVDFETDFFPKGTAPKVDLSRFEKGNYVLPGTYRGDVIVNQKWSARTDIVMGTVPGTQDTVPCFSAAQLVSYGIDLKKLAADPQHAPAKPLPQGQFCAPLGDYIPGATASFSGSDQVLTLSVPQIYTLRSAQGFVDPSQWDAGINAGVLNYNSNVYRSTYGGRDTTSAYAGINASLSLGSWHAYHLGAMTWSQDRGEHYQSNATYLQHDIPSWQAQVAIGDTYTAGDIFDSFRLRGARIYSDDRMLPQSVRGYAPVVRGVAETNARVRVKQNGYIIYETTVAPGPFVVDDLYPTGYGGDLDVEVTEADGRIKHFTVPYAAVPMLLRPGLSRWSIAAGKVSQLSLRDAPSFFQGTYQRGLTNVVTGYAGTIVGSDLSVRLGWRRAQHACRCVLGRRDLCTQSRTTAWPLTHPRWQPASWLQQEPHRLRHQPGGGGVSLFHPRLCELHGCGDSA